MPGFIVSGVGSGVSGQPEAYYQHTWSITNLFETQIGDQGSDAVVYLKDCTLPTFSVGQEKYQGSALEYKFAKSVSWDDVKVTWYDTEKLLDTMTKWRKMVWTPDGGIQPASQYKKQSTLNYQLPEGGGDRSFTLINSWPSTIRHGDLTYTQSDIKVVEVTATYDWCEEN